MRRWWWCVTLVFPFVVMFGGVIVLCGTASSVVVTGVVGLVGATGKRGDLPPKRLGGETMALVKIGVVFTAGVVGGPNLYFLLYGHGRDREVLCVNAPHFLHDVFT